jgi:protease I
MKTSGILQGVRVAILVSDGFEASELLESRRTLDHHGAATFVIAPSRDRIVGSDEEQGQKQVPIDIPLKSAKPKDFHALFLPGGDANANHLATNDKAVGFVKDFMEAGKPVAAIGEASAILLQTGALQGRTISADALLEADLRKAGANYIDKDVVCDGNLITARSLDDISAFDREMTHVFAGLREHSTEMRKIL